MRYAIAIPDTWYAICNIGANGIFLVSLSWYWDQSDLYKIRQPSLFWVQLARTPLANWSEKPIQRCSSKYKVWIMHQNLPAHLFKPARTSLNTFTRSSGRGRQKSGSTVQLYKSPLPTHQTTYFLKADVLHHPLTPTPRTNYSSTIFFEDFSHWKYVGLI